MAERKSKAPVVEVTEPALPSSESHLDFADDTVNADHDDQQEVGPDVEQFNEHIKSLVELFSAQHLADIHQRLADLETLSKESEALQFTEYRPEPYTSPEAMKSAQEYVPTYQSASQETPEGGAQWYRGH